MNSKNICLVTEEFRPSLKGGIATWSYGLVNYLNKQNYGVTVFLKKRHGINKSKIKKKNLPYKIILMKGRDWAYFKKWYVKRAIFLFKKEINPIIISTNWELSEGINVLKTN